MIGSRVLGAPGVYWETDGPLRRLTGVRMDVCAFVGVAPRGPVREPVRESPWPAASPYSERGVRRSLAVSVESWTEYVRLYGGFSGPGLLPYAVHAFFRQGGRRAHVVRIVHGYGDVRDEEGRASAPLSGLLHRGGTGLPLRAASPGDAGNGIRVRTSWTAADLGFRGLLEGGFALDDGATVGIGDLLRVELAGNGSRFHRVDSARDDELAGAPVRVAVPAAEVEGDPTAVQRVGMTLDVDGGGSSERHADLGLTPAHPRWVAAVLEAESVLLRADPRWAQRELRPASPSLVDPPQGDPFRGGGTGRPARGAAPGVRPLDDGVWLEARSEGRWGDRLRASLSFRTEPVAVPELRGGDLLVRPGGAPVPLGATLLLRLSDGTREVRTVIDVVDGWHPDRPDRVRRLVLDAAPAGDPVRTERVEAELRLHEVRAEAAVQEGRSEVFQGLGLTPAHPRWIHGVVGRESELARAHPEWAGATLEVTPGLLDRERLESGPFRGGADRYADIVPEDFFDPGWSQRDEEPGDGIQAVGSVAEAALLVVPDLYSPGPLQPVEDVSDPVSLAGPAFAPCVHPGEPVEQADPVPELAGLRLDPDDGADLERIVELQGDVAGFAADLRSLVALLDVPPGLDPEEIVRWRGRFGTAFAAAYHPWTEVSVSEDGRPTPIRVNPAAVAAGIVARVENEHGVPHGPANALARDVVRLSETVAGRHHDALHPLGINVFRRDPDGVRLTGARTLSRDPSYRQLSVRRLMTMIARVLERQMAWTAFEPNGRALRGQLTRLLTEFLRGLHRANAFAPATEEDAFFVRCDETLNPPRVVDAGRLLAEVGVAPAEPAEFLVLRLARDPDGSVRAET